MNKHLQVVIASATVFAMHWISGLEFARGIPMLITTLSAISAAAMVYIYPHEENRRRNRYK